MPQEYFYHISQKFIINGKIVEIKGFIYSMGKVVEYILLVNGRYHKVQAEYFEKQKKEYAY